MRVQPSSKVTEIERKTGADKAKIQIFAGDKSGSAAPISKTSDGKLIVLTNKHVTGENPLESLYAKINGKRVSASKVIPSSQIGFGGKDLAAIVLDTKENIEPVKIASEKPQPSKKLYVLNPFDKKNEGTSQEVQAKASPEGKESQENKTDLHYSGQVVAQGSSGSGVVNEDGELVGINKAEETRTGGGQERKDGIAEDLLSKSGQEAVEKLVSAAGGFNPYYGARGTAKQTGIFAKQAA